MPKDFRKDATLYMTVMTLLLLIAFVVSLVIGTRLFSYLFGFLLVLMVMVGWVEWSSTRRKDKIKPLKSKYPRRF